MTKKKPTKISDEALDKVAAGAGDNFFYPEIDDEILLTSVDDSDLKLKTSTDTLSIRALNIGTK